MGVYRCPVCEGRGTMPANFYDNNTNSTVINTYPVTCRSCNGRGVVYDSEVFRGNIYNHHEGDPGYMSFQCKGTCSNCEHNDRMCYTSLPPKWKCTLTSDFHTADYRCEHWAEQNLRYSVSFQETMDNNGEVVLPILNATGLEDSTVEQQQFSNSIDGGSIQTDNT